MDRVARFGVSLPSKLVGRFDRAIADLGYSKRSKAIADAINDFIVQKRVTAGEEHFIGSISYIYDHHVRDVNKRLVELQHKHHAAIKSTMHSHITHSECVEVLIVDGKSGELKELYGSLSAIRGVENCKMSPLKTK